MTIGPSSRLLVTRSTARRDAVRHDVTTDANAVQALIADTVAGEGTQESDQGGRAGA